MGRANLTGHHMVFGILFFIGAVLFLWFCLPAVCKGMLNAGNLCGMLGAAAMMFYGLRFRMVHQILACLWQQKPTRVLLLLLAALALVGALLLAAAAAAILGAASRDIPDNTPAIVLGCSVKGSHPSVVLQERIDAAYAYLQEHPQAICILSGGQGKGENISEAECMYRGLVQAGVDADRLYQEDKSANTKENLENSAELLGGAKNVGAVTVISSEFHLYRGRWWADQLGYQSYGYGARTDWKYLPTFFLREMIAVVHLWVVK